ncbi:hypothetical protein IQ06DRAFT_285757 [Phaeosphaeriaceae sp. SRC1lsM3a]|nr:hypothetical protein IQ06DRAFT_285757 [Stagonospora sp. SRC1lsM3a]
MVSLRTLITSALALAAPIAAQTAAQIVSNVNILTQQSQALQPIAQGLVVTDVPLLTIGQGRYPQIINGLAAQTQTVITYGNQMQGAAPITDATEATNVYNAVRTFVHTEQRLLNTLTGKAFLTDTAPFIGAPVSAVLRSLQDTLDAFQFGLINKVPSRSTDLATLRQSLDETLDTTIERYSGPLSKRSLRFGTREAVAKI